MVRVSTDTDPPWHALIGFGAFDKWYLVPWTWHPVPLMRYLVPGISDDKGYVILFGGVSASAVLR